MPDETQKERHAPHVLTTLAGVLIASLLLAAVLAMTLLAGCGRGVQQRFAGFAAPAAEPAE